MPFDPFYIALLSEKYKGNALGLCSPLDLLNFNYLGARKFIPIRLNIDLTESETGLTMIEPRNETLINNAPAQGTILEIIEQ